MATMLCPRNGTLPLRPVCIPSTVITPRLTKLHISFCHTSASLINAYTCRPLRLVFCPVIRALDRPSIPSRNDKNENRILRSTVGASLVLACAIGIINASLRRSSVAIAGPRELYQKAPQVEVEYSSVGKTALKSLLDLIFNLASSDLEHQLPPLKLPSRPSASEVDKDIKMYAVKLMKYGKPEDAVIFLQNAYHRYRNDPEPAYNVEMALVEILICQQNYEQALECNCLKDEQLWHSDGRVPLYKAIIYTMLDNKEEATKWWEAYVDCIEGGIGPVR